MKGIELHMRGRATSTKTLDHIATIAGVIGPLMTVPQIYDIYHSHTAVGVSITSWLAFGLIDIVFIVYGLVHKDRLILSTYVLWCIANLTVALGVVLYR